MSGLDGQRWEVLAGLEAHVQLLTASKMFCGCSADYAGAEPNTHICAICLGLPGSLPVPNEKAVRLATRAALALGCAIAGRSHFDRKNYFYPDLPKGYQITQSEAPLGRGGSLTFLTETLTERTVAIERVHMEEDTAKLIHAGSHSLADFNRAGVPLIEIVTRPELRSADEAKAFLEGLRHLLRWLGVSSGNMEAGALRADVNVSVRPRGSRELGVKVEVKNLNSFAAVRAAVEHEAARLAALAAEGAHVEQETRGWSEVEGRTVPQRSKELAHDYRYFPEPDLPPLELDDDWLAGQRAALPELPSELRTRLATEHALAADTVRLVTRDRDTAEYFAAAASAYGAGGPIADWLTGPLFGLQNAGAAAMTEVARRVPPAALADLARTVDEGVLTLSAARDLLGDVYATGAPPRELIAGRGLGRIDDRAALREAARAALRDHPKAVADYCGGKRAALAFLVGRVMHTTRGQADANAVSAVLAECLEQECAGQGQLHDPEPAP